MASAPDGVEAGGAFFAAQFLQLLDCCGLPDVLTKDGNVDIFGESLDQAVAFGERCSPLEEQARTTGFEAIEERIEGPAYPEVFLDVLFCGAEPVGSGEIQIAAFALACRQYSLKSLCHC